MGVNHAAVSAPDWVVDYGAARRKAIEWLKDRYLLVRPVQRLSAAAFTSRTEAGGNGSLARRPASRLRRINATGVSK